MTRFPLLITVLLFFTFPAFGQVQWDWHIGGGTIIDGSGGQPFAADLLIRGDSIGYVGPVDRDTVEAAQYVDAAGMVVTPGFIDIHAHGDPRSTPRFRNFLAMGVTTIVLGQDGSSPGQMRLAEWFEQVEGIPRAVNVAALGGHGTIRAPFIRDGSASEADVERMEEMLAEDLQAGAWGMSLGLEYVPGILADAEELRRLAEVVGAHRGIIMSHMRSEDDDELKASMDELAELGEYAPVHVSHLKSVYGKGADRAEEILGWIRGYRDGGIEYTADTYPYFASYTGISIVFPGWAKTREQWRHAMDQRPDELREYLVDKVRERNGPEAILFGTGSWAGKTLQEVADEQGRLPVDVLLNHGPQAASAAHFVMDEALQDRLAVANGVMISSDGSPTMHHPRGYGSFARIIRRYVIDRQSLGLEEAVYKMSGLPAETLGLQRRGLIREGFAADILVFDPQAVRDPATFEQPHLLAEGFGWVWVNGQPVRRDGEFTKALPGVILKREKGE